MVTSLRERHRVTVHGGPDAPALVLVHGYGADQRMWRHLIPFLGDEYCVVTYDQAGAGGAEPAAHDPARHASLQGYADDLLDICAELDLGKVVVVGHSIAAMIGVLAHLRAPDLVAGLVMLAPTPRFVDAPPYDSAFSREEAEHILEALSQDFERWARSAGPGFMGDAARPELGQELTESMLAMDPDTAAAFARVTFLSDTRRQLSEVQCPALVVHAIGDPLVPPSVAQYVQDEVPDCAYAEVEAPTHFPHVVAPEDTALAIRRFLERIRSFLARTGG